MRILRHLLIAALAFVGSGQAYAVSYSFQAVTNNNPVDVAIGVGQLSVDVTDPGAPGGPVLFTFSNSGLAASSITDIYFDNGGQLLSIASIVDSPNAVDFGISASPPNLPSGNTVGFTADFSADSEPPVQPRGVNPTETVGILFNLQPGQNFASVLNGLNTGSLRIGLHVQGFSSGGSESFATPVPEPEIYAMMLAGLGLMGFVARRRRQTHAAAA